MLMASLFHTLECDFFPFVEKPIRYIGNELHIIRKDLDSRDLYGVLCFPEIYDIGMSHFGSQLLYHVVNKEETWALSRCYHPWIDAEKILREKNISLFDLEYYQPLIEADWLGFTVQYELQYTNLINMLDLANIPQLQTERESSHPLIIAGGPCMINPEPLADFLDALVIGDGESTLPELCRIMADGKKDGASKEEVLVSFANIDGVYVPKLVKTKKEGPFFVPSSLSNTAPVRAAKEKHLANTNYPEKPLVPLMEVVHHRLAVEVMRGCTRGCRFCSAGSYYRPVRERSAETIVQEISSGCDATGWEKVGLLSLSTADYSHLEPLLQGVRALKDSCHLSLSIPSTRIDALSPDQFKELNEICLATSFTIAPEAGSQRLRNVINKDFTEEIILEMVETLCRNNIQTIKLYFMIGLPTELQEDIEAIITLVDTIAELVRSISRRTMINVSLSPFSPKPHTPFQWEALEPSAQLNQKGHTVKQALKKRKNVRVSYRNADLTVLETILARGDRAMSAVIQEAWRLGARFDGWDELFNLARWQQAAANLGIDFAVYTNTIPEKQTLPWSSVSLGISQSFLRSEWEKAQVGTITADCRSGPCSQCGVCGLHGVQRKKLEPSSITTPFQRRKPTPVTPVEKPFYYRLTYAKDASIRFISHRDMITLFHRAIKGAHIPVVYSQGFHPHPRISFGPPLPMGTCGDNELFDIMCSEQVTIDRDFLSSFLPNGITIKKCRLLPGKPESLNAAILAATYCFKSLEPVKEEALSLAIKTFLSTNSIMIQRERKGKTQVVDLRSTVYNLTIEELDGTIYINGVLSMIPGKTCRPAELLAYLFPEIVPTGFLVTRTACLQNSGGTFSQV